METIIFCKSCVKHLIKKHIAHDLKCTSCTVFMMFSLITRCFFNVILSRFHCYLKSIGFIHFFIMSDEEDFKKENLTNIARGQMIPEEWGILFADGDQDIPYNNIDALQVRGQRSLIDTQQLRSLIDTHTTNEREI